MFRSIAFLALAGGLCLAWPVGVSAQQNGNGGNNGGGGNNSAANVNNHHANSGGGNNHQVNNGSGNSRNFNHGNGNNTNNNDPNNNNHPPRGGSRRARHGRSHRPGPAGHTRGAQHSQGQSQPTTRPLSAGQKRAQQLRRQFSGLPFKPQTQTQKQQRQREARRDYLVGLGLEKEKQQQEKKKQQQRWLERLQWLIDRLPLHEL
jgi:hypothetical protein